VGLTILATLLGKWLSVLKAGPHTGRYADLKGSGAVAATEVLLREVFSFSHWSHTTFNCCHMASAAVKTEVERKALVRVDSAINLCSVQHYQQ
jgi:hypothetical protein